MSCASTLMFALLMSMQPPDEQALPKYDEAPPPELVPDTSAPEPPAPLSPERVRRFRKAGIGLTIAGAIVLPIGVAGLGVAISGTAAQQKIDYEPGFLERERRAELRETIGMAVGISCTA